MRKLNQSSRRKGFMKLPFFEEVLIQFTLGKTLNRQMFARIRSYEKI